MDRHTFHSAVVSNSATFEIRRGKICADHFTIPLPLPHPEQIDTFLEAHERREEGRIVLTHIDGRECGFTTQNSEHGMELGFGNYLDMYGFYPSNRLVPDNLTAEVVEFVRRLRD